MKRIWKSVTVITHLHDPIKERERRTQRLSFRLASVLATWLASGSTILYLTGPCSAFGAEYAVTNTADHGTGSLRQAIQDANNHPNDFGPDQISFAIPGTGPHTISLTNSLPEISEAILIDGYTQPGANGTTPLIHLNGGKLTNAENGVAFSFGVGFSVVRGLVVEQFPFAGISVSGGGTNQIDGNVVRSNTVGVAMQSGEGNLVQNNVTIENGTGVFLFGVSQLNTISNNRIGIDETGIVRPNNRGVDVECSPRNVVSRNIVVGNTESGVVIRAQGSINNVIESNTIANNSADGVLAFNGASATTVANNHIAFNAGNGVHVASAATTGVAILQNSISSNGKLGIDLGGACSQSSCSDDGVTPNDPGDTDAGPNNLQNFPVLTSICNVGGTTIQGRLNSALNTTYRLEFFSGPVSNPSGYGEGTNFLGFTNVTTDPSGNASFAFSFPGNLDNPFVRFITATATDPANNTSEFSPALRVGPGPNPAQQAYFKASNIDVGDNFAFSVAVSGDTMVVGAPNESSNAAGVNGNQNDNSALNSGAAYVFARSGTNWVQQAYLKASNTEAGDGFGLSVAVSGDTIVVGARDEDSNATGVNGNQSANSATNSGAAYVFVRSGTNWVQQAYLKASNTEENDNFGVSVSVSGDTVVVGATGDSSSATGVNGDQSDNSLLDSGAAYVFVRSGTNWDQQAYLKASNTGAADGFGRSVAVSGDTVVVGALGEDSNAVGVNGDQSDNSAASSGAAYVFARSGTNWSQQAYLKASNTGAADGFGLSVAASGDTLVVGAIGEDSNAMGVNGDQSDNSAPSSGAAYVFVRSGANWSQQAYLKASNTGQQDFFGWSVGISGDTVVIGAPRESSNAAGVNCNQNDNSAAESGAAYAFVRSATIWTQQAYLKPSNTEAGYFFGNAVAVSGDMAAVGASREDSGATAAGAAYLFTGLGFGPQLAITRDGTGGYFVRWAAHAGFTYHLQLAVSVTGPWTTLAALTAPASGLLEYHDNAPLPGQAFYRTVQP